MATRTPQAQYERDFTALKHYLIGRGYYEALRALGIAVRWHVGFRKDKKTPQLHHQVWVCFNFLNTPILGLTRRQEERALAAILLHDTVEDIEEVTYDYLRTEGISLATIDLVRGMTKIEDEADAEFFERLLEHWLLPIMKACDRDNNVMTMHGAFAIPKMKSYILETRDYILVLLKKAGNLFPEHQRSYAALASGIKKQLRIYEGFIASAEASDLKISNLQDHLDQAVGFRKQQTETLQQADNENAQLTAQLSGQGATLHSQAAALNRIGDQVKALIDVNDQLRANLIQCQTAVPVNDLMISHIMTATCAKPSKALADFIRDILAGKTQPSTLETANEKAEVIPGLGPTDVPSNTVFRTY